MVLILEETGEDTKDRLKQFCLLTDALRQAGMLGPSLLQEWNPC